MTRHMKFFVCLIATLSAGYGLAQESTTPMKIGPASSSSPVAYVYASTPSRIYAYSASSSGKLIPVPGSPFAASEQGVSQAIVATGKYLFGINSNGNNIDSFSIAPNGALKKVASIDAIKFNDSCGGGGGNAIFSLFLDHTGSTLYDLEFNADICANNAYQYFSINKATGELTYRGVSTSSEIFEGPLHFSGNNEYAYDATPFHLGANVFGFKRSSNGELTFLGMNPGVPNAAPGSTYLPYLATPDPTNHLAMSLQPYSIDTQSPDGPTVLATYSGADSGKLTSTSTHQNMPAIEVNNVNAMNMSPSGKLLAVAGSSGLQVFHFNGSSPITHFTGLLTTDGIDQIFWDRDNHLYAISHSHGKLFVFDATPSRVSPASGSPYSISKVENLAVVSK